MIYITGDTHRDFQRVRQFCNLEHTTQKDILIILGDAGINYIGDGLDDRCKNELKELPITLFCVHGNHERRPSTLKGYKLSKFHGGLVYEEKRYPNILFAKDGEVYDFDGNKCIVIGGAYSVDKYYRLSKGYLWFADEQPSDETKQQVESKLETVGRKIDIILSHTCPLKYVPTETLSPNIDQSTVDVSTEKWLDSIEDSTQYSKWYCGHYHIEKAVDKMQFLYREIVRIYPTFQASKIDESEENSNERANSRLQRVRKGI